MLSVQHVHIRGSLDHLTICTIAAALVSTRLDYANSILYGIHAKHISRSPVHSKYPCTRCYGQTIY